MGFLAGNVACTRFNVTVLPELVDFETARFFEIQPGSNLVESMGFVPFELDEEYTFGKDRYAFRVRIDKINVDSTRVKEHLRVLVKAEEDRGAIVGSKLRKKLKTLAEQDILAQSNPRTKVIEAVIDRDVLYVGSTSKSHLGAVLDLLNRVGVQVEYKTPWLDANLDEEPNDIVEMKEPGQSIYGCRFLKWLLSDPDMFVEPEKGSIKLATPTHARVNLSGEVLGELDHYLEEGAEILTAKLLFNGVPMTFDGTSYRINSLKLETVKGEHWTETLDGRLDMLRTIWDALDEKWQLYREKELAGMAGAGA